MSDAATPREGVLLIHGLALTKHCLWPLERFLRRQGYVVYNLDYHSRKMRIEALAESVMPGAFAWFSGQGIQTVHVITHSMGGILLRGFVRARQPASLGRVVMICPPNQGSELVDLLGGYSWFQRYFGPAGCQLGTGEGSFPRPLGPVSFPLGVLGGNHSSLVWGRFFPGANDGKVAVERMRVEEMADFLVLPPYSHTLILYRKPVWLQALHFLRHGCFARETA